MVVEGSQLFQQLNVIIQRAPEGDKTAAAQVAELVIKGAYREIDVLRAMVKDDESDDQADGDSAQDDHRQCSSGSSWLPRVPAE